MSNSSTLFLIGNISSTSTKKSRDEGSSSSHEDEQPRGMQNLSFQPFKVEARIEISVYDRTIDAERLDNWIDWLELDILYYPWIF